MRLSKFSAKVRLPSRRRATASSCLAESQLLPTIFQLLLTTGSMTPPLTVWMYSPSSSRMPPTSPRTSISSRVGSGSPGAKMSAAISSWVVAR